MQKDGCRIKEESRASNPRQMSSKFSGQQMAWDNYQGMASEWYDRSPGTLRKLVGVPAVLMVGIGMMMIGKILFGLVFAGVGVVFVAVTLSVTTARKAFWISAAGIVFAILFAICALSHELTGKAIYEKKGQPDEPVTRESSPAHFRYAVNSLWTIAGISSAVAAGGFAVFFFSVKRDRKSVP